MIRILAFLEAESLTGPAKNLLEFGRQLKQRGAPEIQIEIAPFHRGAARNAFTDAAEDLGIPLHRIPESAAFDYGILPRMAEIIASVRPDVLQTHALKSHFLMRLTGHWKRHPWVAFHHGYTTTSARLKLYNQLDRWSLRKPVMVVTVSEAFRQQLQQRGVPQERIHVLHNAVDATWGARASDPELRLRSRTGLGIRNEEAVLLIVGRLSKEKAHTVLVEAVAQLRNQLPHRPVRLVILGDGPERPNIVSKAEACGITDQLLFAGHAKDVAPFYAAADLAVLSSITEGSPNALLEAMASQVPVVATAVGGIPEIVTHRETALLVPPLDVVAMTEALAEALNSPESQKLHAERAYQLILSHYTPEERARHLGQLYAEAVAHQ